MGDFLADLTFYQKIFFVIAASSTIILIIQTILSLFGLGDHDSGDGDISADAHIDSGVDGHDSGIDVHNIGFIHSGVENDSDSDVDSDADDHSHITVHDNGLRLFTIRGIIAFLMMGGWVGFLLSKSGVSNVIATICAFVSGFIALVFIAKIMQMILGLQEDGTMKVKNALGQIGQVYIRIPAEEKGMGKVNVTVQETLCEFDAITEKNEPIKTGEMVYVTDIRAGNVLVVEKVEDK